MTIVIAGGGTGGHVFPGVAVAHELVRRVPGTEVAFVGTARGLEARLVPCEGFEVEFIRSAGLKGKALWPLVRGLALLPLSFFDAWRILSRRRPRVVVGVGGYSSGPVVLLAAWRGIATMVLEQNATPGLTNRWLAPWIRAAALTYEQALPYFRGKGFVTGNPVRSAFLAAGEPRASARAGDAPPRLLILGGSQGARAINRACIGSAGQLAGLVGVHQTGPRDLDDVRRAYREAGVALEPVAFLDDVAGEMRAADLVVARAGATTLAELAAVGRAAVLVPFGAAADDHQRANARALADRGAAVVLDEAGRLDDSLGSAVRSLFGDRARLERMHRAMAACARPDAAARVVDRLLELSA